MNVNYTIANALTNEELRNETRAIIDGMTAVVNGYYTVGTALQKIAVTQIWKQGNFASFADYTQKVLGISKPTAYRIIAVCKKFLSPELELLPEQKIFSPFEDTALAALNPIGDYDTTAEFITEYDITPSTPVSKIRKIVSEYQKEQKENEETETDEETETELQQILNKISELSFAVLEESGKAPSKRKKTPVNNLRKEVEKLKTMLKI